MLKRIREDCKREIIERVKVDGFNTFIVEEAINKAFDKVARVTYEVGDDHMVKVHEQL